MNLTKFQRECPKCKKIITYSKPYICERAKREGKQCKKCKNANMVGVFKNKVSPSIEQKIISLHSDGLSNGQISEKLGITTKPIKRVFKENSLHPNKKRNRPPKYSPFDKERLCCKCNNIKIIDEFKIYGYYNNLPYRGNVCNPCVAKKIRDKRASSIECYFKSLCGACKCRAEKNNIPFNITYTDLIEINNLQRGMCFYTNVKLEIGINKNKSETKNCYSIDRIIPELGYVKNNIVLCARQINTSKNDLTLNQIKMWMPKWYKKIMLHQSKFPMS